LTAIELLYEAETDIMKNIVRNLSLGKDDEADWLAGRLRAFGSLSVDNEKTLAKFSERIIGLSKAEVAEAAKEALSEIEPQFIKARKAGATLLDALPANASPALRNMVKSYQGRAVQGMNYTMQTMLSKAGELYVQSANKTSFLVLSGSASIDNAIAQTVREWSKNGIPSIIDKAGRKWSTESYAQAIMRSTVRSVTTDVQFTRADEYGVDLIEISSHVDAREGCAPYQGKVYSRNGTTKGYPQLASTSYGDPAGLFGVNCRHQSYPFFPGLSTKTFPERKFNETAYKNSQTQRMYERQIRQSQREIALFEKTKDKNAIAMATKTLERKEDKLKEFLSETNRKRRYTREMIYDVL